MKYVWAWLIGAFALYMTVFTIGDFIKAYRKNSKCYGKKLIWPHQAFDEMTVASLVWLVVVVVLAFFVSLMAYAGSSGAKETKTTAESTVDDTSTDTISVGNTDFIGIDLVNNE